MYVPRSYSMSIEGEAPRAEIDEYIIDKISINGNECEINEIVKNSFKGHNILKWLSESDVAETIEENYEMWDRNGSFSF